ncbi:MAG: DUF5682 family protein [Planctomycetota bacterium]
MTSITFLGIRHHGPGSARSMLKCLERLKPDLLLVEGPEEAEPLLPLASDKQMKPPVALLVFAVEDLTRTVFYPFTQFSPEWQAILYSLKRKVPLKFFDLPQTYQLAVVPSKEAENVAIEPINQEKRNTTPPSSPQKTEVDAEMAVEEEEDLPEFPCDPLDLLATSAGFSDGERWWEYMVEQRHGDLELFQGIQEAMTEVRTAVEKEHSHPLSRREALREAWMRRSIRESEKKFKNIVVICGAWHVPALAKKSDAKTDEQLLKDLPKIKVQATWVPWTNGRISYRSGYGAGVAAPGWYEHLWDCDEEAPHRARKISGRWFAKVASLLRKEGLDISTASIIECVRLAESLCALREKPLPGLDDLNDAILSTLCFGNETPLKLIHEKLIVGERLGEVPPNTPTVPLQQDLNQIFKKLRKFELKAEEVRLDLDLRKPYELEHSYVLHRMNLLGIPWGKQIEDSSGKGTFWERWSLKWEAEFAVRIIERNIWGTTLKEAASQYACNQLRLAPNLLTISNIINHLLLAHLPSAMDYAVDRLESETAVASDVIQLMEAILPLGHIVRYSNVRQIEAKTLVKVVDTLITRVCIGLPNACSSLDEDAAEQMLGYINATHDAIRLLQNEEHRKIWGETLFKLANQEKLHGLVSGRCYRLLLENHLIDAEKASQQMSFSLSSGNDPLHSAAWINGFLHGSGLLLLHNEEIWSLFDSWLTSLSAETFLALIPFLRRTFSSFPSAERRQMGEKVQHGTASPKSLSFLPESADFDVKSAEAALPLIAQMLGLTFKSQN